MRLLILSLVMLMTSAAFAQPVQYRVSFPDPSSHYVEVEGTFPTLGQPEITLTLPVWTPGSYLVREYSRHLEDLDAGGLPIEKVRKNRWTVKTEGADTVTVRYRIYGREMTVRNNWVEDDFALINGAPTFLTLFEEQPLIRPHDVVVDLPANWSAVATGLPPHPDGQPHHYRAQDYAELVDCPILMGNLAVHTFTVDGVPHQLVNYGEGGLWDGAAAARDVAKIVEAQRRLWGFLPYDRYLFLNLITEARGGLEHRNSTVMMTSRWAYRDHKDYLAWLSLVSHEFYHTWNVKRLKPREFMPHYDLESEVYTPSLWVAEGVTSYYDDLMVRRAGISTDKEYLEALSGSIEKVQTTPGRLVHPLSSSSYDAWIKLYRPDENSVNTTISYYTKGLLVAWLLDVEIRRATKGGKTLDDLMRVAYERYVDTGYTDEQFRALASEVAGKDLTPFFDKAVDSTQELDYQPALDYFGLRFKAPEKPKENEPTPGWLGADLKASDGKLIVTAVKRETPAFAAGLNVDDEVLAVENYRIEPARWEDRFKQYRPGQTVELLIARREKLERVPVTLGEKPRETWKLEVDPDAPDEARKAWLSGQG